MEAKWCIEKDFFWEKQPDTILGVLDSLKVPYKFLKTEGAEIVTDDLPFAGNECVVVHGTIGFTRKLNKIAPWIPGASWICEENRNLYCSNYYAYLGDYLLNREYMFTTLAEFERRKDWIFNTFGEDNKVFIRPDSPYKDFTGFVVQKDEFDRKIVTMSYGNLEHNLMMMVAKPQKILAEYRFYLCQDEVITGSRYMINGEHDEEKGYSGNALRCAEKVSKAKWRPSPVFVADIGELENGECKLLEVNSLNCSGMYYCDMEKIVKKVNELALFEWEEVNI